MAKAVGKHFTARLQSGKLMSPSVKIETIRQPSITNSFPRKPRDHDMDTGNWKSRARTKVAIQEDVEARQQIIGKTFHRRGIQELGHCFSPLGEFLSGGLRGGIKSHHVMKGCGDHRT